MGSDSTPGGTSPDGALPRSDPHRRRAEQDPRHGGRTSTVHDGDTSSTARDERDSAVPATRPAADTGPRRHPDTGSGRPTDTGRGHRSGLWDRLRGRNADEQRRPDPWRVEGMPQDSARTPNRRPRGGGYWWWLLAFLVINWIVVSVAMAPPSRTEVSYTFFSQQLNAGNVQTVTSTADAIQGAFTKPVGYPPGAPDATQVALFTTQRPSFATDDLFGTLAAKGVTVNAIPPDAPPPLWQQVVVGFGPTLLFVGLLLWFLRRRSSGRGWWARRARRVRPIPGGALPARRRAAHDIRRRRRHRRGRARGERDRRVPPRPAALHPARRADPARRAALRPARHGQDSARQGGGR